MSKPILYSVIESNLHPRFSALYSQMGFQEEQFDHSIRKAMSAMKKQLPAVLVADFIYGYSNNYAGVNISNLDVMLMAMKRYSPDTRVIVLAEKHEIQYVAKLEEIFPLHALLQHPADEQVMKKCLDNSIP